MKYLYGICLLIFLVSCEKFEPVSQNQTKVIVHFFDAEKFELSVTKDDPNDFNNKEEVIAKVKIDKNGEFVFNFPLNEVGVFQLKQDNAVILERIYLYPNDDLKIEVNNSNKDDITFDFKGKSSKVNKYIQSFTKFYPRNDEYYAKLTIQDVSKFIEETDSRKKEMIQYFDDYFFKDTVPELVKKNEYSIINFDWAYLRNEWTIVNYYYRQENWDKEIIPAGYWEFLKNLIIEEPYLHNFLGRYLESLLWDWHIKQVKTGITPTAQTRELAKFEIAKQKFTDATLDVALSLCLNDLILYTFDERMLGVLNKLMDDYKLNSRNKGYFETINSYYKKRLKLLKGSEAPDLILPNSYNAPISLKDFKGKPIYVYFWSMQFDPSVKLLDNLNVLQSKYMNDERIIIISVAMDENILEKWKRFLTEKALYGIHVYCDGLFTNKVAENYMINSIPYALIVDKNGRIFMMNAPYPNDETLPGILEGLINNP